MLNVKLLHPGAKAPTVAHPGEDLGYDVFSNEDVTIPGRGSAIISTGIAVEVLGGGGKSMGALLRDKSSLASRRLIVTGGVIDAGYRGEVKVIMENLADQPYVIHAGDKIANLIPYPVLTGEVEVLDTLGVSTRNDGGFGSTGKS